MCVKVVLIASLFLVGCSSLKYVDYRGFRTVGLAHDIGNVKNVGMVRSQDCGLTILNNAVTAPPSFEDAIENAVSLKRQSFRESIEESFESNSSLMDTKVKLLTNIQTREEGWNLILIGRKCVIFTATAYQ